MVDASAPLPPALRALSFAATALGLFVLALVIAYWSWRWWGPEPLPRPPLAQDTNWAARISDAHLFGKPEIASKAPPAAGTSSDARLLGIFAQDQGRGYALFRLSSGARLVAVGDSLPDGTRLDAVRPDSITVSEGGKARDIALRPRSVAEKPPLRVAAAPASNCAPPQGFNGSIFRLNAELLGGMATMPDTWKALLQPGGGGLVVRDQSGLAAMLGLQNGDRLERANGLALKSPEDVVAAVLRPLTRSLPVELVGRRAGAVRQWLYLNAGSCPG